MYQHLKTPLLVSGLVWGSGRSLSLAKKNVHYICFV